MKIIKLISNQAAAAIIKKHTKEEIDNGIVKLVRVDSLKHRDSLWQKLLEEVGEAWYCRGLLSFREELDDLIEVCKALKGEKTKYSERWALISSRGHYKNEED